MTSNPKMAVDTKMVCITGIYNIYELCPLVASAQGFTSAPMHMESQVKLRQASGQVGFSIKALTWKLGV